MQRFCPQAPVKANYVGAIRKANAGAVLLSRRLFLEPTSVYAVTAVVHAFDEIRLELEPVSVHLFVSSGPPSYAGVLPAGLAWTSVAQCKQCRV